MITSFPSNARQIKGFPDYAVDAFGNVFSRRKGTIKQLKSNPTKNTGYCFVCLMDEANKPHTFSIHQLVLQAFKPIHDADKSYCNHIDGNKSNNLLSNLEWVTASENVRHAIATKLRPRATNAKLREAQVHAICQNLKMGLSQSEVLFKYGDLYSVTRSTIYHIATGRTWTIISNLYFDQAA